MGWLVDDSYRLKARLLDSLVLSPALETASSGPRHNLIKFLILIRILPVYSAVGFCQGVN
ncbi:hypothetical protein C5L28_001239 [Lentilactobacillus parakefiri]|uniref:Uncharacterized protein n=1 Tax=Lentilactobacillus parakefiri TaxID=152332 RepID=A0A224V6Q2_9LACO|nr:hypothetical protein C5L28_001239 [Lentilactobacillus parakefiri]GAW72818.1 hypothetical protein LPKJCM_01948 [Lentilactobacillus parakefiri]